MKICHQIYAIKSRNNKIHDLGIFVCVSEVQVHISNKRFFGDDNKNLQSYVEYMQRNLASLPL